jgi:hypothetical protein
MSLLGWIAYRDNRLRIERKYSILRVLSRSFALQ